MDYNNILLGQPNQKPAGTHGNIQQAPLTLQGAPNQQIPLAPKPATPKPVVAKPKPVLKPIPQVQDLSGNFGINNGTVYNKQSGQAYSTPDEFFNASGVKSFDGVKLDTAFQPFPTTPQAQPQAPQIQNFSQFKDTTTPEQFLASAAKTSSAQQEAANEQARLFQNYLNGVRNLGEVSPEEKAAKDQLLALQENARLGVSNLEGQGRGKPLGLVRGQQGKLLEQAGIQEQTLQQRLANIMSENQSRRETQAKAAELEYNFAKDKAVGQKPMEVSAGSSLIRLNPATGQYENVYSAPQAGKTMEVNGEIVQLNPDGSVTKLYGQPKSDYGTGSIGEYNFYAAQEKAAGRTPISFNDYQTQDANRSRSIVNVNSGSSGIDKTLRDTALKFSDDYEQASKSFVTQAAAYNRILASSNNPSPAGDMSLIFGYMKLLDPTSTVREGEYATAAQAGAAGDKIAGLYNKTLTGEKLTPAQRADFVSKAKNIYESAQATQKQVDQTYSERASKFGVPSDLVVRNLYAPTTTTNTPLSGQPDLSGLKF